MNKIKELQETIDYLEIVKDNAEKVTKVQSLKIEQVEKEIQLNRAKLGMETRNKERTKQLKHGHELAERLRSLADSVEASGVVDVHLNFANTGIIPLPGGYDGKIRWLDSGSRRMELNYILPKN